MNRLKHILHSALVGLPMLLAGCSAMDTDLPADEGMARLTIGITARDEGDLNTRAAANPVGQQEGRAGEYISRLYVFIVDQSGKLVWKSLAPELVTDVQAMNGNVRSWTSGIVEIPSGTYTVYAFANLDSYYSTFWASLTGWEVGTTISQLPDGVTSIDDIVLTDDPASKIDLKDYFIPMSAKENVTVTPATTSISIGLDRLVSKVTINVLGTPGTTINGIIFGGYADRIGLFEDTQVDGVQYNASTTNSASFGLAEGADVSAAAGPYFYVNSSALCNEGYNVTLTTDEMGGTTYQATTKLSELPRNSVFPLILQLDNFALDFTARCWLSPIGAEPTPVIVRLESEDTYSLRLPESSQFELTLNGVNTNNTGATNVSCTWSFDKNTVSGLDFEGYQPGSSTVVKGHVTASAGQEFPLTCEASWTIDGTQYHRTYTVNVITDDIFNFDFDTSSNAAQNRFGLLWLNTEMLNMSRQ